MSIIKVDSGYTIELESENENLGSATTKEIHWTNPKGTKGELTATLKVGDTSIVTADITEVINKMNGEYKFETYVVIGSVPIYGTTFIQEITRHFF